MVQANTVAGEINAQFGVPVAVTGLVLTIGAAVVLLGGIKSIGRFTAAFVPFMAIAYILGATYVLAVNAAELPSAIAMIVSDAFTGTAATGGFAGASILFAIRFGVARGDAAGDQLEGAPMTSFAFSQGLPGEWGGIIVTLSVAFFAFSTLLGWSYYGERCMDRLFGRGAVMPYRGVFVVVIFIGAIQPLRLVWDFADLLNGLMALPNLVGLLVLSPLIARETKAFLANREWRELV